ncbi:MAG TPA: hypothetical protein VGH74_01270, partial [Planctomycetaceae bacterium]
MTGIVAGSDAPRVPAQVAQKKQAPAAQPQAAQKQPAASALPTFRPAPKGVKLARGTAKSAAAGLAVDLHPADTFAIEFQGRLFRELARQAVLIAARDELGLPTRDKVLGEPLPDDEQATIPTVDVTTTIDDTRHGQIAVWKQLANGFEIMARHDFVFPAGGHIETVAHEAHVLSRHGLPETLKKAGFQGQARPKPTTKGVAPAVEQQLDRFDLLSQFANVRALHAEIRTAGESPELLAALTRGYANLGILCECLWCQANKVFQARALLYAERLVELDEGSSRAHWSRAYVRAFVGLHKSALAEIDAARKRDGNAPSWGPAIEKFCHSDDAALDALSSERGATVLPIFLRLLLAAHAGSQQMRQQAALRVLEEQPYCTLAMDLVQTNAPLGILRQFADGEIPAFSQYLRTGLPELEGGPEEVRRLLSQDAEDLAAEMKLRKNVVDALQDAGRLGRDVGEPSFAALGELVREVSFVHAFRLVNMQGGALGIDANPAIAALAPICDGHPAEQYLKCYLTEKGAAGIAHEALISRQRGAEMPLASAPILARLIAWFGAKDSKRMQISVLADQMALQSDRVFADMARLPQIPCSAIYKTVAAAVVRDICPESPIGVAMAIQFDWNRVQNSAVEWEQTYQADVNVIKALAD